MEGRLGISEGNEQKGKSKQVIALLKQFFCMCYQIPYRQLLMIINTCQQSPRGLIYIKTVYLNFRTFKIEALVQLLPETMFILGPYV